MQGMGSTSRLTPGNGIQRQAGAFPNGNSMVLFGDSITLANATHPTDRGFFNHFNCLLGFKFNVISNAGVGGDSTTQMLARIQADVISKGARWACVMGGINDVAAGTLAVTITTNLRQIYTRLHAARMNVIACTITPSTSINTEGLGSTWATVNQWIRDYGAANPWLLVADVGPGYWDETQPTLGVPKNGYTSDGRHPNNLGAGTLGLKMHADLKDKVAIRSVPEYYQPLRVLPDASLVHDVWDTDINFLMTGTTGAKTAPATGTVADHWTVTAGGTWSKVARTDGKPGVWQQCVLSNSAGGTLAQYDTQYNFAVGDVVWGEAEFESDDDWVSIQSVNLQVSFLNGSNGVISSAFCLGNSIGGGSGTVCVNPRKMVLRIPNTVVPALTAKIRFNLAVMVNTSGSGTFRWSRGSLRKAV